MTTPKLNVATVDQALGLLDCLAIIRAGHRFESNDVTVSI
jgi:hypothetical protein